MPNYVLRPSVVSACIKELRGLKIHPHFEGYLGLKRVAASQGSPIKLKFNHREFFDTFFRIPNAPPRKPYLNVCNQHEPTSRNLWSNENTAGSYAPSSIRNGQPLSQVVTVERADKDSRYSLNEKHWQLARKHLLYNRQLPILPLLAFLYRDFAFEDNEASVLVSVFRSEFGYPLGEDTNPEFEHLYIDDSKQRSTTEWFEAL